jgi:HEAT repeat protein
MKLLVITVLACGLILGVVAAVLYTAPSPVRTHPPAGAQESPPRLQLRRDISALIEGLKDSDAADREIWNRYLILLTGLSFDFKPNESLEERDSAIQRWRQWWEKNKDRTKEEWLMDAVRDKSYKYRVAALKELRKMRAPVTAPALMELLKDQNVELRKESVEALAELSLKETVPAILEALTDSEPEVRRRAARALGAIGDPAAVPGLLSHSEDSDLLVRVEVAQALAKLSRKDALPVLLSLLKSDDVYAASFAADSISLCADENSVPVIAPLLTNVKTPVRVKLIRALHKITGQSLGEDPKEWLKWHESRKSQQR